jgi:hypothetical protein
MSLPLCRVCVACWGIGTDCVKLKFAMGCRAVTDYGLVGGWDSRFSNLMMMIWQVVHCIYRFVAVAMNEALEVVSVYDAVAFLVLWSFALVVEVCAAGSGRSGRWTSSTQGF